MEAHLALKKQEKEYIVDRIVEILKSPRKSELIEELREKVMSEGENTEFNELDFDSVIYSVILAIDELYS